MGTAERITVGRTGELALVEEALADASRGAGRVILVEGEAGIGKSHLIGLIAEAAVERGVDHLGGGGEELEQTRPFGVFARALPAETLTGPATTRFSTQERIVELFQDRLARTPMLVTVDDLQWADEPSLGALAALVRRAAELPLLVLLAHRPVPALPEAFIDAVTRHGGVRLVLDGLPRAEVGALVAAMVGAAPGDQLLALVDGAGGNPFLVIELVRSLGDEGVLAVEDGVAVSRFHGLPPTLRHTVLRRLRHLTGSALELLRAGAVLGGPFGLEEVAAMLDRTETAFHADVVAGLDAGLLEETEGIAQLRFRHDLLREAVYADMPATIRASLHRRAAQVLAERNRPAVMVADHHVRAGGGRRALDVLQRAAVELGDQDPAATLALLERAAPMLEGDARLRLAVDQVTLMPAAGRLSDARDLARAALAAGPSAEVEAELRAALAQVLLLSGDAAAAVSELEAVANLDALAEDRRVRALADTSWARLASFDLEGAARDAVAARRRAQAVGDADALLVALVVECRLAAFDVRFDEAVAIGRQAIAAFGNGDVRPLDRAPHFYLGLGLLNADRADEAVEVLGEGRHLAEAAGVPWAAAMYHAGLITCAFHGGRWDDAVAEAEAARLLHADAGTRREYLQMESMLGLMWLHRGEYDLARDAHARAEHDRATPGHDSGGIIWLLWLRAAVAELTGDTALAARSLGRAFDLAMQFAVHSVKLWYGPELVRLALAAGDVERAAAVAAEVVSVASRARTAGADGAAAAARGMIDDDPSTLAAAVDHYRRSSRRFDLARACEAAGDAAARNGSRPEATIRLEEAFAVYEEMGAVHDQRRITARLRELGVRKGARGSRARPATGIESLTPTEHDVLRLVGEGLTNSEIAERLYVSRRTVESHMSHLYAKLQVRGRVALARLSADGPVATDR